VIWRMRELMSGDLEDRCRFAQPLDEIADNILNYSFHFGVKDYCVKPQGDCKYHYRLFLMDICTYNQFDR
jgi:hypothetical protein